MKQLIGAVLPVFFSKNFKLLLTGKIAPDIIHFLEKEGITQCVYHIHLCSLIW